MDIRAMKYSVLLVSLLFYASGMDINIPDMCEELKFLKLYANGTVRFVISNDPNELESYWSKYSSNVKCKIAVNFTQMIQSRRTKLVLKINVEPNIGTRDSCLFDVGLYLANSNLFVPVKTLHCYEVIDPMSLHWPEEEFVLGFKMRNIKNIITHRVFNMTITVTPETCDSSCYMMISKNYRAKVVTMKQPKSCGASSCIDFTASEHSLLSGYDFLDSYDNHHQSSCSIFFSLKSPTTICIKVHREGRGFYDSIFTPATLMILLDGKIYLNLSVKNWLNYWCIPKEWFQKKSQLEVRWSELDVFLSYLGQSYVYIRTNSSVPKSLSKCSSVITYRTTTRKPYREYGTSRPNDHGSDTGYIDTTSNTFFAPVLGIVSFAAFIIGVCCLAAYVRSKNQRLIRNRRQRVNTARFTRNVTDSTPRETFPYSQGARPAVDRTAFYTGQAAEPPIITYRPPELDLPPPYPGKAEPELPPPSYEESCVTISTNINRDK